MTEYEMPIQYGWICPRCGQVNAPWLSACTCSERINVAYSDRTEVTWISEGTGLYVNASDKAEREEGNEETD